MKYATDKNEARLIMPILGNISFLNLQYVMCLKESFILNK